MILKCYKCGYEWDYKGKRRRYATCPDCKTSVNIKKKVIRDFLPEPTTTNVDRRVRNRSNTPITPSPYTVHTTYIPTVPPPPKQYQQYPQQQYQPAPQPQVAPQQQYQPAPQYQQYPQQQYQPAPQYQQYPQQQYQPAPQPQVAPAVNQEPKPTPQEAPKTREEYIDEFDYYDEWHEKFKNAEFPEYGKMLDRAVMCPECYQFLPRYMRFCPDCGYEFWCPDCNSGLIGFEDKTACPKCGGDLDAEYYDHEDEEYKKLLSKAIFG